MSNNDSKWNEYSEDEADDKKFKGTLGRGPWLGTAKRKYDEHIARRYEYTCPERERREEERQCRCRAEEFRKVCTDDSDLAKGVQRVEDEPAEQPRALCATV